MTGLLLRLAGPLQAWGERSAFSERDTASHPTRSGLIGMFAAAMGKRRVESIDEFRPLTMVVRVDRPGVRLVDFHTIGGGLPRRDTTPTAEGKRRSEGFGTIVSRRHYLADAVFAVAVTGPEDLIVRLCSSLRAPKWGPYLGRRACPPDEPLLLAGPVADVGEMLHNSLPLARRRPHGSHTTQVEFLYEQLPVAEPETRTERLELADPPESFAPHDRRYGTRGVHVVSRQMSADLCAGRDYLERITDYLQEVPR